MTEEKVQKKYELDNQEENESRNIPQMYPLQFMDKKSSHQSKTSDSDSFFPSPLHVSPSLSQPTSSSHLMTSSDNFIYFWELLDNVNLQNKNQVIEVIRMKDFLFR